MTTRRVLLVAFVVLTGCSRSEPSPEYAAAREKHAAIVAAHPADAAGRPEMDEVLQLLRAVPEQSADAPAARELRERLTAERDAASAAAAQRAEALARAGRAPEWPSASSIGRPPERPKEIAPGTTVEELRALHAPCVAPRAGEVRLEGAGGTDRSAEAWNVDAGDEECRAKYPSLLDRLILVADGAVVAVRPAADARAVTEERVVKREERRQVELVELPGGGWGMRGPDGKIEPIPAGAEVRTVDGKPLPPPAAEPRR